MDHSCTGIIVQCAGKFTRKSEFPLTFRRLIGLYRAYAYGFGNQQLAWVDSHRVYCGRYIRTFESIHTEDSINNVRNFQQIDADLKDCI